jgi:hypothetical protein
MLEFTVAFSAKKRKKALSKHAFNTIISGFFKDVLDMFVVASVNDELIASAAPLAIKHNLRCLSTYATLSRCLNVYKLCKPL